MEEPEEVAWDPQSQGDHRDAMLRRQVDCHYFACTIAFKFRVSGTLLL